MYVGFRPQANNDSLQFWHNLTQVTEVAIPSPSVVAGLPAITNALMQVTTPTVTSIKIEAHGIPIYAENPELFYNAYTANTYGKGCDVTSPEDRGAYFIPFNLYQNKYNPSGHINVSRAREFYLYYTSSFISTTNLTDLIITANALNFLLVSDGSCVLRYST
jgi:hypothetical protein